MAVEKSTAIGVFEDNTYAERGIKELRKAGFADWQVGYVTSISDQQTMPSGETNVTSIVKTTTGVVGGGVLGYMLVVVVVSLFAGLGPAAAEGMLAATLGGAVLGAVTGGFMGTLIDMGIPANEARYYQEELERGRTVVTVKAGGRYQDALAVLRQSGAYDASYRAFILQNVSNDDITSIASPSVLSPSSVMLPVYESSSKVEENS